MICEAGEVPTEFRRAKNWTGVTPILLLSCFAKTIPGGSNQILKSNGGTPPGGRLGLPRGTLDPLPQPNYEQRNRISCTQSPFLTFSECLHQVGFIPDAPSNWTV